MEHVPFASAIVKADTDDEIRKKFDYSRTFYGDKSERKRAKQLQDEGRVTLVSFEIVLELGTSLVDE